MKMRMVKGIAVSASPARCEAGEIRRQRIPLAHKAFLETAMLTNEMVIYCAILIYYLRVLVTLVIWCSLRIGDKLCTV